MDKIGMVGTPAPLPGRGPAARGPVDAYAGPAVQARPWPGGRIGTSLAGVAHVTRGLRYVDDVIIALAGHASREVLPSGSAAPPRPFQENGKLRVVSWNLHQGVSPDDTGSKPQLAEILRELRAARGDCYVLQEVAPWHVQKIVDAAGMPGYYTATTFKQGNLVLVHPDVRVEENEKRLMNFPIEEGDLMAASRLVRNYVLKGGGAEPRAVQALRLRMPDGSSTVLWNTHVMSQDFTPGERLREARFIVGFLDSVARPGERIVGGGDLNSVASSDVVREFTSAGYEVAGGRIDFIVGRGLASGITASASEARESSGLQISDHPIVTGEV